MSTSTTPSFRWPLAVPSWDFADKLSIAAWLLRSDRFTMGAKVAELEQRFSEFSGVHALMVANGSVANQLVFELWKIKNPGVRPVVICPAVTWISSISPALMAGCEVVFCDINLRDFALDYDMAERLVENHRAKGRAVILWPTALIGWAPDMTRLQQIAKRHGAHLFLDSCENTFSRVRMQVASPHHFPYEGVTVETGDGSPIGLTQSILASADMTTTSGYVSHHWTSVESGFVFFRNKDDYDLGRLFRNHGLVRSLPADHPLRLRIQRDHPDVDPQFLFALAGTNLRPTDVHAVFGLRDFARIPEAIAHRQETFATFRQWLHPEHFYLPPESASHVGFCFPIFAREASVVPAIKGALTAAGVEHRPIIGGALPLQPVFKDYGPPERYPNALWVHRHGCYVGQHLGVTRDMVIELCELLNSVALEAGAGATVESFADDRLAA